MLILSLFLPGGSSETRVASPPRAYLPVVHLCPGDNPRGQVYSKESSQTIDVRFIHLPQVRQFLIGCFSFVQIQSGLFQNRVQICKRVRREPVVSRFLGGSSE